MYVLLNRGNIVVDILDNLRYIKLQSSNGIVVACSEEEGTGVIGSDCDTHYVLIQADTINSPNAVRVIEVEEIPSNVTPNLYKFEMKLRVLFIVIVQMKLKSLSKRRTSYFSQSILLLIH